MASTIWKFEFPINFSGQQEFELEMPCPAIRDPLLVAAQGEKVFLWIEVYPDEPMIRRRFFVVGTGRPMPEEKVAHVGSCQHGPFVWHIFEAR